jgi:hypothetical protein
MPPDVTFRLIVAVLLGFAIWGSWFYAVYRGVTLQQRPGRKYWAWLVLLGISILVGTTFAIRYLYR